MSGPRSESLPDVRVDVVQYPSGEVKAVPAGKGGAIAESHRRRRPRSVLRDRTVVLAAGLGAVVAAGLSLLVVAYSVLVLASLLFAVLAVGALWAAAAAVVVAVVAVRWLGAGAADLLEEDVSLRDAREQWGATPVSAVERAASGDGGRERAAADARDVDPGTGSDPGIERVPDRDHAVEGDPE